MRINYSNGIERRVNRKKEAQKRAIKWFAKKAGETLGMVAIAILLIIALFYGFEKEGEIADQTVRNWKVVQSEYEGGVR